MDRRTFATLVAGAATLAISGCYDPAFRDCVITCGAHGTCPTGLSCSAGFCSAGVHCYAHDAGPDSRDTRDAADEDVAPLEIHPNLDTTAGDAADDETGDVTNDETGDGAVDEARDADVNEIGARADGEADAGETGDAPIEASAGLIVDPWAAASPPYLRNIVLVGGCTGVALNRDWILTTKNCETSIGTVVTQIRPALDLTTTVDRIEGNPGLLENSMLAHLRDPIEDAVALPLFWGKADEVLDRPVTCYGYHDADLMAATLVTRAHADQKSDPGTFETIRDSNDATILPAAVGGPCFLEGKLAAIDGGLRNPTAGLETGVADFRSWMFTILNGHRGHLFQVTSDGFLYILDRTGSLWREDANGGKRALVDERVRDFRAVDGSAVYVIDLDRSLWREQPDSAHRTLADGPVVRVWPLNATTYFVMIPDRGVWRETNSAITKEPIAGNILNFDALDARRTLVIDTDLSLWRMIDGLADIKLVESRAIDFATVTPTTAYVLRPGFDLWHENLDATGATKVDDCVIEVQAIDDAVTYVLTNDRTLWRETGSPANRERIDGDVGAFQAIDATTVFVMDQDGQLWREGTNRTLVDSR